VVEPGGRIHGTDPYAEPAGQRRDSRRFRGRLAATVTLWTAGVGRQRAGLTVASAMLADGEPPRLLGLIDPLSDLADALADTGRFTVQLLAYGQQRLAERFSGQLPAPGGVFAQDDWADTDWGPVVAGTPGWAGCRLDASTEFAWSLRIEATVEHLVLAADAPVLGHYRGRYQRLQ
jgi:3-hydroxy-9,10-secoandrosta-1,3,5(10)-triene-9,17-dione monooxygenase reductase component